jgi:hypothetical protein
MLQMILGLTSECSDKICHSTELALARGATAHLKLDGIVVDVLPTLNTARTAPERGLQDSVSSNNILNVVAVQIACHYQGTVLRRRHVQCITVFQPLPVLLQVCSHTPAGILGDIVGRLDGL